MKHEMPVVQAQTTRVALFIDGENLSSDRADEIVAIVDKLGLRGIRNVYGDATRITGWRAQGTLKIVDSAQGKNAADMLLAVEAMEAALFRGERTIAIASCDRDFSHLARKLAEHSVTVIGIGPADPGCAFRKACVEYKEIEKRENIQAGAVAKKLDLEKLEKWIMTVIGQTAEKKICLSSLGTTMKNQHGVSRENLPNATWKSFLSQNTRFRIDANNFVCLAKK